VSIVDPSMGVESNAILCFVTARNILRRVARSRIFHHPFDRSLAPPV
jgi:hypothetical protein